MWLKIIGSICIIIAASGLGIYKGTEYKRQIEEIEKLKRIIWQLHGEMKYLKVPLQELCSKVSRKSVPPYDSWLQALAEGMEKQEYQNLGILWKNETAKMVKQIHLPEEEKRELMMLGYQLGHIDLDMQMQTVAWYENRLEEKRKHMLEHANENARLCNSLGIAGGVLFVILIW